MSRLPVHNLTWREQPLTITDKTHRVLSNGRKIPTELNMLRKAKKI